MDKGAVTKVYITIDTEYSAAHFLRAGVAGRVENFDRSIRGAADGGDVGVGYQMDVFDAHGIKAVFFVDPMPALVWGTGAIADVTAPILARGHDVQLHCHTEWLKFADADGLRAVFGDEGCGPVLNAGRNIKDYTLTDQTHILRYAAQALVAAGAPFPVAFRAGNYGANDDTLRALAATGIAYDSSHCPGIARSDCDISLPKSQYAPVHHEGVFEIPIGAIAARGPASGSASGGGTRHAQVTALSAREMIAAVRFAHANDVPDFTIVSHSFELLSRDRLRANRIVKRRFEQFCRALSRMPGVQSATYKDNPPALPISPPAVPLLPHNPLRTGERMIEQALSNLLYGAG